MTSGTIGCACSIFSSASVDVDQPVFVWLATGSFSSSNRTLPSCFVELMLNEWPAIASICAVRSASISANAASARSRPAGSTIRPHSSMRTSVCSSARYSSMFARSMFGISASQIAREVAASRPA